MTNFKKIRTVRALCSMWMSGHMTNRSHFANAPHRTAAHLSKNETPSVWHSTIKRKCHYRFHKVDWTPSCPKLIQSISSLIFHLPGFCKCILPVWFYKQNLVCISHRPLSCYLPYISDICNLVSLLTSEMYTFWNPLCSFLLLPPS